MPVVIIGTNDVAETARETGTQSSNPRRIAIVSQMCINIGVIVISVKNALIDPATLTSDLLTPKPQHF